MRILQVIHGFLPQFRGGTELYLLGLARALRDQGHEIEIVAGTTHDAVEPKAEAYEFDGFPVTKIVLSGSYLEHWTRSFSPEATRLFAATLQRVKPDIVHIQHWFRLSRSLVETCHRLGIPAVCTLHDLWTTCPRIFRIRDESFCDRPLSAASCTDCVPRFPFMDDEGTAAEIELFRADFKNEMKLARRIIVPSQAHGDVIADSAEIPEERLLVLPHGTIVGLEGAERPQRPERRRDPARKKTFGKLPTIRLGMWGHIFHMKGTHLVLEALGLLGKRSRRFELHVWGNVIEPRYKARLEELSDRLDVTWHGAFSPADLGKVELDCALIPSLCSESFSFVLDEAFDLGLPAIVSDRGALAERIGEAGAVFIAEDAKSLAGVLERLADEPERLERWRRAIPALEPMTRHASSLAAVYAEVLAEEPRSDLVPDPGLAWRRLEHQTRVARRYEALMFGQIGHIKREMGRGDHYEGEMRRLMREKDEWNEVRARLETELNQLKEVESHENKIISVLAAEIETFRRSLVAYLRGDLGFTPERPEFADLPEHVPNLGPISVLVDHDHELLSNYGKELARRRGDRKKAREDFVRQLERKESIIDLLGKEILAFRQLLQEIDAQEPVFDRVRPPVPEIPDHVPDLGPIARVLRENHEFMRAHFETLGKKMGEAEKLGRQVADLESKLASRQTQAAKSQREMAELGADRDRLQAHIAELREQPGDAAGGSECADCEARLRDCEQALRRRDEDMRALDQSQTATQKDLTQARTLLLAVEEEIAALRPEAARVGELSSELARKETMVAALARIIEEMRRSIAAIGEGDLDHLPEVVADLPDLADHVPGLGDLSTIATINTEMAAGMVTEFRRLRDIEQSIANPAGASETPSSGAPDSSGN